MRILAALAALAACHPDHATRAADQAPLVVTSPKPSPACPTTPSALAPAADAEALCALDATGFVIYACRGGAWMLVDADAVMAVVGRVSLDLHHLGTSLIWNDASSVTVALQASAVVDSRTAPWLLWNVTSHGATAGALSTTTQVQRLSMVGGAAPTAACGAGNAGQTAEVAFSARYYLYQRSAVAPPHQRCGG